MKKLIPLMILATVVSCGKKMSRVENGAELISNMLMSSEVSGQTSSIKHSEESYKLVDGKFEKDTNEYTEVKTILKRDGNLLYTLLETPKVIVTVDEDGNKNFSTLVKLTVSLEDLTTRTDNIHEMIKKGEAEVKNDSLVAMANEEGAFIRIGVDGNSYKVTGKTKAKMKKNLISSCESVQETKRTNVVGILEKEEIELEDIKTTIVETCGKILTSEELKSLNLLNVRFCDERGETSCEDSRDMSFLTSDL